MCRWEDRQVFKQPSLVKAGEMDFTNYHPVSQILCSIYLGGSVALYIVGSKANEKKKRMKSENEWQIMVFRPLYDSKCPENNPPVPQNLLPGPASFCM